MSDTKLTPQELAALDLMIADLQAQGGGRPAPGVAHAGAQAAFFTPAIARTLIAVTRIATRYTPQILDLVGGPVVNREHLDALKHEGGHGVSVDQLIQLRQQQKG